MRARRLLPLSVVFLLASCTSGASTPAPKISEESRAPDATAEQAGDDATEAPEAQASPSRNGEPEANEAPAKSSIEFVGLHVPPAPDSLTSLGGLLIMEDDRQFEYSVEHLYDEEESMLWLKRMRHRDDRGRPHWEVVAVQRFDTPGESHGLALSGCGVESAGHGGDGRTFAVVRIEDVEEYTDIREAWRVDVEQGRFVTVSASEVRCFNEGWGI